MQTYLKIGSFIIILIIAYSFLSQLKSKSKTKLFTEQNEVLNYQLGRFKFKLPKEFSLKTQNHSIDYISFNEVNWESSNNWQQETSKIVKQRIEEINKEFYPPEGYKSPIIDVITNNKKNTILIIYYNDELDQETINIEMFYACPTTGVWLNTFGFKQHQEELINEIKSMATRYVLNKKSEKYNTANHYFINGRIAIDNPDYEEMFLNFTNNKYALSIDTKINETGKSQDLFKKMNKTFGLLTYLRFGVTKKTIRKRERTVANIQGQELIMKIKDKHKENYYFTFNANGKKDNALYPDIIIELDVNNTPNINLDELLFVWDNFLESFSKAKP